MKILAAQVEKPRWWGILASCQGHDLTVSEDEKAWEGMEGDSSGHREGGRRRGECEVRIAENLSKCYEAI